MRGERRLGHDQAGVSPVIGVILMVVIVVALGAVVFVVVGGLSKKPGGDTPKVTFTKLVDALQVVTAPEHPTVDWSDLTASGTCAPHLMLSMGGSAPAPFPTTAGSFIGPGDRLSGCGFGETLILSHRPTNTVVYSFNF
ncbi:MAG: type IV pilin [Thermoplasmatota archaeon]